MSLLAPRGAIGFLLMPGCHRLFLPMLPSSLSVKVVFVAEVDRVSSWELLFLPRLAGVTSASWQLRSACLALFFFFFFLDCFGTESLGHGRSEGSISSSPQVPALSRLFTLFVFLDHVYYRWTRSIYRLIYRSTVGQQSTDISVNSRPTVD